MSKKNNPYGKGLGKKEWWVRYRFVFYIPSLLMSIAALIISIVQLLR